MAKFHQTRDTLEVYFDPKKNPFPSIHHSAIKRKKIVYHWICKKGHRWQSTLERMLEKQTPCQTCRREQYWEENSLNKRFPNIFKQLHPLLNAEINIEELRWTDDRKVWWLCLKGHEYKTTVRTRTTQGTGCSFCSGGTSKPELRVYTELAAMFSDCRLRYRTNKIEIDVYLPEVECGIEYDGSYWHKEKLAKDSKKNKRLAQLGITIFRLREEPLEKINERDVVVPQPAERHLKKALKELVQNIGSEISMPRDVSNQLLAYAASNGWLDPKGYKRLIARLPAPPEGYSLLDEFPDIARDWNYVRNHPLRPEMFKSQAHDLVFWRCEKGHEVHQRIQTRVISKYKGCPKCSRLIFGRNYAKNAAAKNPLSKKHPQLTGQWHPTKNKELKPEEISAKSSEKVWWLCEKGHEYKSTISNRASGSGCPYCSGHKVGYGSSVLDLKPDIAITWCEDLNGALKPDQLSPTSGVKVWWKCPNGHTWKQQIRVRVNKGVDGCMQCRTLAHKYPDLVKEWHLIKNDNLTPEQVSAHSGKYVWWQCTVCGHEWETSVHKRTSSHAGCPKCQYAKVKVTRRSNMIADKRLLNSHPDIQLIWDFEKNTEVDLNAMPTFSKDEVWFKCPQGESFVQKVSLVTTRKNLLYCPVCKRVHSKEEFGTNPLSSRPRSL